MRGLIWDGTTLTEAGDLDLIAPGPGQIAVEIQAAGLCHSDMKPIDGEMAQPVPAVLGHEAVGVVRSRGAGVTVEVGQRVVLSVLQTCGTCAACLAGRPTLCTGPKDDAGIAEDDPSPFRRDGRVVERFRRLGAFAEQTVVRERQAVPISDDIPDTAAALLGCAVVTAFGAVEERARVEAGESVLVVGAGGLGLNVVQAARLAGAKQITVIDRNPRKAEISAQLGATDFAVAGSDEDVVRESLALRRAGYDAVFECVGTPGLLNAAVRSTAWGGRTVMVGVPPYGHDLRLDSHSLFHDKALLGCRMGGVDPHVMIPSLVQRYRRGELLLEQLVTAVRPLAEANEMIADLRAGKLDRGVFDIGVRLR
jgi:Zn-dependent alcohol dehydrogenase